MNKSESIVKITAALSKFQAEVKNPPNSSNNPFFKSKYAPLDVVINTAKDVLGKYGLSYIQMPGGDGASVSCVTILMCEGEWIESDILILKADKVTPQGAGSAITYARRYQLSAMLGLAGELDDDGNGSSGNDIPKEDIILGKKKIDTVKVNVIKGLMTKAATDEKSFLKWAKVVKIEDILVSNFVECTMQLEKAVKAHEVKK